MNARPEAPPTTSHRNVAAGIAARAIQIVVGFGLLAAILFLAAGRMDWLWAWVSLGIYLVSVLINGAFMLRASPAAVAERGRPGKMRDWDKLVSGLWSLAQFVLLPLTAGLDARWGWTRDPGAAWHIGGAAVFAAGLALFGWAMITNAYFSTAVRIQTDRGHTVCRSGPYRAVRHPGYVGAMLQSLGLPALFGSAWALLPGVMAVGLLAVRALLEDRTLQAELPGYREYVQEVRYRLVPGVW